jgi:hypothetical protein
MRNKSLKWTAGGIAVLVLGVGSGALTQALADDSPPLPARFTGLISDYSPAPAGSGPWELRGKWWLDLHRESSTADFSAAVTMETSDGGIPLGVVDPENQVTRTPHSHHIHMTGVVTQGPTGLSGCPRFKVPTTTGFVVTGTADVSGNGGTTTLGGSKLTICILGGNAVEFSNITLTFGAPASGHFGGLPISGVVIRCEESWERESSDCTLAK